MGNPTQHRSRFFVVLAMCALAHSVSLHAGDRSDEVFIRQLLRRNLFDVAERFCETRRARSLNVDEGSAWARRLADITAQQAWLQDSASRNELLNRQIDELESIFNTGTPLNAESRIRTRFAQIRLIQTGLTIQQLLEHAGHLCSRPSGLPRAMRPTLIETQMHSANSDETVELLNALLTEIDRDRSELGNASAELRDQGRLLKSTFHLLRAARAKSLPKTAKDELGQAMTTANAVVRATRETATKKLAYELIAKCHLIADSISDLESHVRRLDTLYPESTEKTYELLLVLSRLRHQDVDGAMLHLSDYTPTTAMDLQLVAWLRLEAALIRYETAVELQDADLTSEASTAFRTTAATTRNQTSGAYREAAERVIARFELTESVGVEVADLVELISVYRKQNKLTTALGIIAAARQRLPVAAWRAKAALDLSAGEILISQSAYENAQEKLTSAVEAFGKSNDNVRQSAADLLRIYAFAQTLTESPDPAVRERYATELRNHLRAYPGTVSARTARTWLVAALRNDRPLDCYRLLKDELAEQSEPLGRFRVLEQMALIIPSGSTSSELDDLHDDYRDLLRKSFADGVEKEQIPEILRFLDLEYAAKVSQPPWPNIYNELKDIGRTLPAEIQRIDPSGQLQSRHLVLLTVATARTKDEVDIRRTMQNKLTAFNGNAQSLAEQISSHIDETSMQRGDQWLGNILEILIRRSATEAATVSNFVELLRLATHISQLTGRSDVQSEVLERLTSKDLKPDETTRIAAILQQGKGESAAGDMHKLFWAKVVENNPDGSDLWLEATVQLAELAATSGQKKAAKRRLGVTNTLYPDWGNEKRRQRALGLLRKLQE